MQTAKTFLLSFQLMHGNLMGLDSKIFDPGWVNFFMLGSGRVRSASYESGKFPPKTSIFFTSDQKKSHRVGSKYTWVKVGQTPYLLRAKSMLGLGWVGSGQVPSLVQGTNRDGPWLEPKYTFDQQYLRGWPGFDPPSTLWPNPKRFFLTQREKIRKFGIFWGNLTSPNPNQRWLTWPGPTQVKKFCPGPITRKKVLTRFGSGHFLSLGKGQPPLGLENCP